MILIVSLCAVLIVARGVTMVWMAEAAWDWWRQASSAAVRPNAAVAPSVVVPRLPVPAPADISARPIAEPMGSLGQFFGRDNYPVEALRSGEQGRVVARLAIGIDGRPTGCTVVVSSGSPSLDSTTCAIGVNRPRFAPARDAKGRLVPSRFDLKVRWVLED